MGKTIKIIATSAAFLFLLQCLGCGPGTTQAANDQPLVATPNITQVLPQTIPAGSQSTTIKVTGTNFSAQAAILWNGAALSTTVVDANTVSGTVASSSLATPTTVQLQVQNTQTMQSSKAVPVTITGAAAFGASAALTISVASLPQGVVGESYSGKFTPIGGASPYTWSISSGQLPPGLSLAAATGILSGTPTASGDYTFGIKVIDSSSSVQSATTTVSLPVVTAPPPAAAPLTITSTSIPAGTIGAAYSILLQSSGGTAPYAWSITAGGLPNGVSLSATTGLISGTPTAVGATSFTAAIADSSNPSQSKAVSLTLIVTPTALGITTSSLPSGTIGSTYTNLLQAAGGTAPYTWSIASGSLPAGLSLAPATGIISGTPTTAGTFNFTATAADAGNPSQSKSVSLSITIVPITLAITSSTLPSATQNSIYSAPLQAFGGIGAYTWSVAPGTLPAGLSLAPSTGVVSGTPTSSGNSSFKVTVTDTGSPAQTATATITISIVAAGTPLAISSKSLRAGKPNRFYSATLDATGGTAPYTWSITNGSLPPGLSLAAATGVISGTVTASSTTSLTFQVTDSSNTPQTQTATLSLVIAPTALTITSSTPPSGTKASSYSGLLQASGGTTPYTWTVTAGSLSPGLSLAPSTGLISGTPTATGTSNFTVTVADVGTPVQTASAATSIVIAAPAPPTLAITTSSMPAGTNGTSYSNALQATGGSSPYAWSITAGSLPAGLSLNQATGLISGTPTTNGTSNFTATLADGGSPAQSKSVSLSIIVAAPTAPALTINATLAAGTADTAYSSPMSASGGTPAYTWSITTGSLPAGLTLAASTGIISGTPSASGTFNFTATVTDNGTPVQTQSATASIVVAAAQAPPGPGTTWYIRSDGGTRYSSNVPAGQCDGQADAAYPGSGTNQHCAFNDVRFLWDDQSWQNSSWVIAGGDTVIIRGGPWRLGYSSNDNSNVWCFGQSGGPYGCTNPPIPAGSANQHTQILGENYASCGSHASETQLFGGFGLQITLNLRGAQFVDVKCIELTRHSQCIQHGYPVSPSGCNSSFPGEDDYAGDGIFTDVNTHDLLLQDMWIHGFTDRGIIGPIGGAVTAQRVDIAYNAMAGWDFDDGSGSHNGNGTASVNGVWNFLNSTIEWNGCNQEYPIVDQYPAVSCYSQSTGGYGDGVGTPPGTCLAANIDGSSFHNNTQDGLDLGHGDTGTNCPLTITNSTAYANNGGTFKWGPNENPAVLENNFIEANCLRMSQPISGAPSSFNANLSDYCRANDGISFAFRQGGSTTITNNTVVSYAPTTFDIQCWDAPGEGSPGDTGAGCANSTLTVENNAVLGYDNPNTYNQGGQSGGPGLFFLRDPIGTIVRVNNLYYGLRNNSTCPTGFPGEICQDPMFINEPAGNGSAFIETELDNFNINIASGSPAVGAGLYIPTLILDYSGVHRPNPPSIGAMEPQ